MTWIWRALKMGTAKIHSFSFPWDFIFLGRSIYSSTPTVGSWSSKRGVMAASHCYSWWRWWSDSSVLKGYHILILVWFLLILLELRPYAELQIFIMNLQCNLTHMFSGGLSEYTASKYSSMVCVMDISGFWRPQTLPSMYVSLCLRLRCLFDQQQAKMEQGLPSQAQCLN